MILRACFYINFIGTKKKSKPKKNPIIFPMCKYCVCVCVCHKNVIRNLAQLFSDGFTRLSTFLFAIIIKQIIKKVLMNLKTESKYKQFSREVNKIAVLFLRRLYTLLRCKWGRGGGGIFFSSCNYKFVFAKAKAF